MNLTSTGNWTEYSFIYFMHSCFQSVLLFLLALFCYLFLDAARYVCKKSNKNTLNIKQNPDRILVTDWGFNAVL